MLRYIALAGGALPIFLLVFQKLLFGVSFYVPAFDTAMRARIFQIGAKLPHGVAIAAGGVVTGLRLPHLELFIGLSPSF